MVLTSTLIQNIQEFICVIEDDLRTIIRQIINKNKLMYYSSSEDEIFKKALMWIIAEELELVYNLFTINHSHNDELYSNIHNKLLCNSKINFSLLIAHYIKAPRLYNDHNQISIDIRHRDLYIVYHFRRTKFRI